MRAAQPVTDSPDLPGAAPSDAVVPVPELVVAPDGRIVECGAGAAKMLGVADPADVMGVHLSLFCRDGDRLAEALGAAAVTGRLERWDADFVRLDGKAVPAVADLVALFEPPRALAGVRVSMKPLTAWPAPPAEGSAPRDEASQLSHELNNLLAIISGHAECLPVAPADAPVVDAIRRAVASAAQVSTRIRNLGPARDRGGRAVDIDAVLAAVQDDLRRTFGHRVAVAVQPAPHPWMVTVDRAVVHRAVSALAAEAVQSMPHGGTLTFRTMNVEVGPRKPSTAVTARPGRYVRLDVSYLCATESGTQPHRRESDDADLAALEALRRAGGRVMVESDGAYVASVALLLPSDGVTILRARPAAAPQPTGRRVVLVEGDATHRRLLTTLLRGQGHEVVIAASAADALDLAGDGRDTLIVTDHVPGDTPAEGAAWLAARPDIRVLGTADTVGRALALVARPRHVIALARPLAAGPLTEAVKALFDGAAELDRAETSVDGLAMPWFKPTDGAPIHPLEAS